MRDLPRVDPPTLASSRRCGRRRWRPCHAPPSPPPRPPDPLTRSSELPVDHPDRGVDLRLKRPRGLVEVKALASVRRRL
eukprot:364192-Chlamydomonas_euryale.AAC.10